MKRKKIWISVIASMLIGTVSVAASSGIELHEFFNEKGEKVIYPWESIENPDLNYNGPQDQVYVGQIIQTEDGPEKVIAVDEQGSYVQKYWSNKRTSRKRKHDMFSFPADEKIIKYFYFLYDQL